MGIVIQFPGNAPKTVEDVFVRMSDSKKYKLYHLVGLALETVENLSVDEAAVVQFLVNAAIDEHKAKS